jgi:hypothetical protein
MAYPQTLGRLQAGDKLPNGATLLLFTARQLLARWGNEYVVWTYTSFGYGIVDTYWGHYFLTQQGAIDYLTAHSEAVCFVMQHPK